MKKLLTLTLLALLSVGCSHSGSSESQNKNDVFRTGKDFVDDGIHLVTQKLYFIESQYSYEESYYDKSELDTFLSNYYTSLQTTETRYDDKGYPSFKKVDGITVESYDVNENELVCHAYDKDGNELGIQYRSNLKTLETINYAFDTKTDQYTDDIQSTLIHDDDGKLVKSTYKDDRVIEFVYDDKGTISQQIASENGKKEYTVTYTRDEYGNVISTQVDNPEYDMYNYEFKNSKINEDGKRIYTEQHSSDEVIIIESSYDEAGREKTVLITSESGKIIQYIETTYKKDASL